MTELVSTTASPSQARVVADRRTRFQPGGAKWPIVVLVTSGVFWSSLAVYALIDHEKYAARTDSLLFYVFLPITLALVSIFLTRLNSERRKNAALLVASSAISLLVAEIFLAVLAASSPSRQELAERLGIPFDSRTKLQVVSALRAQGVHAYPTVSPSALLESGADQRLVSVLSERGNELLPLGGVPSSTAVYCNENGYYTIYEKDEHGFNNPPGIWSEPIIDIAAVGDSYVEGACVRTDEGLVARIRERFPRTLNVGNGGTGPLTQLATLKEYVARKKPRIVLWFFAEDNDLVYDLPSESASSLLRKYLNDPYFSQGLYDQPEIVGDNLRSHIERLVNVPNATGGDGSTILDFVKKIVKAGHLRTRLGLTFGQDKINLELFRDIVVEAKTLVESWGGQFYVVYLPSVHNFQRYTLRRPPNTNHRATVSAVRSLGIPVIDMLEVLERHEDPLSTYSLRVGWHYNAAGHGLVARRVLEVLASDSVDAL